MQETHEKIRDDNPAKIRLSDYTVYNYLFPLHWHNHLEILYIVDGNMTAHAGETDYELAPGDILIINPQIMHYTQAHNMCHHYLLQIPALHMERLGTNWRQLRFDEYIPHTIDKESLNQRIASIFIEMNQINKEKKNGYHLILVQKLYEFLYLIYTEASVSIEKKTRNRTERDSKRIEQCMDFVRKNYYRPISLTEISKLLSLSPEYFCRLFREYTGQTFLEHLSQVRLTHMYQDLLQTDESITYLLDKNGITNYKSFLKEFKKTYGTTPLKLRKLHKTINT